MLPKTSEMQYDAYSMQQTKASYPYIGRISVPGFISRFYI